MGKGEDLNKEVWQLFQNAGFETHPNSANPDEFVVKLPENKERKLDLFARDPDLGVTIIGSNKARQKYEAFTQHMADLVMLKSRANADAALYISALDEVQPHEVRYAAGEGVTVWNSKQLRYYRAVVNAVERFAKYEIIHALGVETREQKHKIDIPAIKLLQPNSRYGSNIELFLFTLPAEELLKRCVTLRRAQGSSYAYQRIVSMRRLPKIGEFLGTPSALLPTNLVVHLSDQIKVQPIDKKSLRYRDGSYADPSLPQHELVILTLPSTYASLELIDGQHRLFGFVHTSPDVPKRFNLAVLGVRGLTDERRSETFVAINDNAKRVDPNLVAFLRFKPDERACQINADLMAIKIAVMLNSTSPLKDSIKLDDLDDRPLTLKGVSGYDLKGLVSDKGLLRKYYPGNRSQAYVRVLRQYFSTIKTLFRQEWSDPKTYIIRTNRGVSAFLKLLKSILKTENKKVNHVVFRRYLRALKKHTKTWETKKIRLELQKSYVGSQGWKDLHREMVKRIRQEYPGFKE